MPSCAVRQAEARGEVRDHQAELLDVAEPEDLPIVPDPAQLEVLEEVLLLVPEGRGGRLGPGERWVAVGRAVSLNVTADGVFRAVAAHLDVKAQCRGGQLAGRWPAAGIEVERGVGGAKAVEDRVQIPRLRRHRAH